MTYNDSTQYVSDKDQQLSQYVEYLPSGEPWTDQTDSRLAAVDPAHHAKAGKGVPRYDDAHESDMLVLYGGEGLVPACSIDGAELDRYEAESEKVIRYRPRVTGTRTRRRTRRRGSTTMGRGTMHRGSGGGRARIRRGW